MQKVVRRRRRVLVRLVMTAIPKLRDGTLRSASEAAAGCLKGKNSGLADPVILLIGTPRQMVHRVRYDITLWQHQEQRSLTAGFAPNLMLVSTAGGEDSV